MKVVRATLGRLAFIYLLLAINIIPCANIIPDIFPTRNLSTFYLLIISVCLIRYYSYRVSGSGTLPFMMKLLSWMAFLLIFLRGIKYSVFPGIDFIARHTWYLYYAPMLLIPLFLFFISLLVSPGEDTRIPKKWYIIGAVTLFLIVLVLTNDVHELIFRFNPNFENWNDDYSYAPLFYAITAWQYILYIAAIIVLVIKCRITSAKKYAWLTVIPFSIGITMSILLMTGTMPKINGAHIIEFPEALIFMVAGVLDCCMQIGLIPTNKSYGKLFGKLSLSAQITDRDGTPIYLSESAIPLTSEQFSSSDGERIGEHNILHKMVLPGGYGLWQDDMSEIDRLNDELALAKEQLSQETELIRLQNELTEKQKKIEHRTAVYDEIAKHTHPHSLAISQLAEKARGSTDSRVKDECRKRIILFASYIKRYANLMLLSYENKNMEIGEVSLSFSEVLRYLNYYGIPGELVDNASGKMSSGAMLALFETFGKIILDNISSLRGMFINLSQSDKTICKLTLENIKGSLSEESKEMLTRAGVSWECVCEDDVTYIGFTLPKGGDTV